MMLSEKQSIIVDYLHKYNEVSLSQAVELIGYGIYANKRNYVGKTLSRMVNRNIIERRRKGFYALATPGNKQESTGTRDLFDNGADAQEAYHKSNGWIAH